MAGPCAVKICHDGMLEDTNSLDGAHLMFVLERPSYCDAFRLVNVINMVCSLRLSRLKQGLSELEFMAT